MTDRTHGTATVGQNRSLSLWASDCRYTFKKQAVELKRKMWWKNMKMTLLIVVPCLIGIFFVVMYRPHSLFAPRCASFVAAAWHTKCVSLPGTCAAAPPSTAVVVEPDQHAGHSCRTLCHADIMAFRRPGYSAVGRICGTKATKSIGGNVAANADAEHCPWQV